MGACVKRNLRKIFLSVYLQYEKMYLKKITEGRWTPLLFCIFYFFIALKIEKRFFENITSVSLHGLGDKEVHISKKRIFSHNLNFIIRLNKCTVFGIQLPK